MVWGPGFCHLGGKRKFLNPQWVTMSLKSKICLHIHIYIYTHTHTHTHKTLAEQTKHPRTVAGHQCPCSCGRQLSPWAPRADAEGSASPWTPTRPVVAGEGSVTWPRRLRALGGSPSVDGGHRSQRVVGCVGFKGAGQAAQRCKIKGKKKNGTGILRRR